MKVGIVIRQFAPQRGGAERWTYQLCEQAVAAGHELHIVAQSFGPEIRHLPLVPHAVPRVRSPWAFAEAAEATLRTLDLDLIHDMGCGWYFDILQPHEGARRAHFDRKLMAYPAWKRLVKRGLMKLSPRYRQFEQLARRQYADHSRWVIALSKMVARDLERVYGWPMERSRLIPNGVDLDRFSPTNRQAHREAVRQRLHVSDSDVLVLFVAHNFELKGLPALLRAVGRLRLSGRGVRLLVLGGDRTRKYARLGRRYAASDGLQFLGSVEDAVPFYAAADVLAIPTWYDSCSLVVLEALAAGLPVITSSHNGAAELLTDGTNGFVIEQPGDWRRLSQTIEMFFDPAVTWRMGAEARRLAERHPLAENCRQVMDLWQHAAGQARRAA